LEAVYLSDGEKNQRLDPASCQCRTLVNARPIEHKSEKVCPPGLLQMPAVPVGLASKQFHKLATAVRDSEEMVETLGANGDGGPGSIRKRFLKLARESH